MEENIDVKERIDYLSLFVLAERFERMCQVVAQRTRYMTVCLENTFHPQNASAVVRTAEALGLQDIYTVETLTRFDPSLKIVRGTDKWVDIHRYRAYEGGSTCAVVGDLKRAGYRIVATTPHEGDLTPETFDVTRGKFAVFFGTEHAGISDDVIAQADEFLKIPMYGFVESLNVSVCAAIIIQRLGEKLRASSVDWQLSSSEQDELLYRWMCDSIKDSTRILERRFGK